MDAKTHTYVLTYKQTATKKIFYDTHTNTTRKTHVEMHWHWHMTYIACPTPALSIYEMCASTNSVTHSNSAALTLRCVCLRLEPSCPESKVAWKQTVISLPCSYSLEWYGLARGQRRSLMQRAQSVWLGETWQSNASSLQRHVLVTASVQIHFSLESDLCWT